MDSRRSSGESEKDRSRSQSQSNRGSTARSSKVQSVNSVAENVDEDENMSRGIILYFN